MQCFSLYLKKIICLLQHTNTANLWPACRSTRNAMRGTIFFTIADSIRNPRATDLLFVTQLWATLVKQNRIVRKRVLLTSDNLFNLQINLSNQSSNGITTVPVTPALTTQYLDFAPWRPLKGDGMCLRIDVFRSYNECKILFSAML